MDTGGKYEFVPPDERTKIDKSFGEMTALFDQYGSVSAMNQDAKVKLFNDQEVVNSILTKRDRDRVICTNQAPVGSHIRQTSCHTYAQEVQAHQETQKQMTDWKVMGCAGSLVGSRRCNSGADRVLVPHERRRRARRALTERTSTAVAAARPPTSPIGHVASAATTK